MVGGFWHGGLARLFCWPSPRSWCQRSERELDAVFPEVLRLDVFELQMVREKFSLMRERTGGYADYKVTPAATETVLMVHQNEPGSSG